MTATPPAAKALTSALGRFERAHRRRFEAAIGALGVADPVFERNASRVEAKAAIASVGFSSETWSALITLSDRDESASR